MYGQGRRFSYLAGRLRMAAHWEPCGVGERRIGDVLAALGQMFDRLGLVTDQRRFAQREPRSLQPEQLGDLPVTSTLTPQTVRAWVVWEDGVEELIDGVAAAWTKRAVRVRFGIPGHMHEVWVWAGAVERA